MRCIFLPKAVFPLFERNIGVNMHNDLTKGSITKQIISFTLPLLAGNIFQLTYNAVDSIIIGRYIGIEAQAAAGNGGPVMNFAILGISGVCIGASVLMSRYYGAKNFTALKKGLSTTLLLGIIMSIILSVSGVLLTKQLISLLKVPDNIRLDAVSYLRIIFLGLPFTLLYNAYSSAMRSIGDSKTPLRFLAISALLNVILDLIFILLFNLKVSGAAAATVISQAVSAVLCIIYVNKKIPLLTLKRDDISLDKVMVKTILKHGLVTALQQSCQPIGKLFIQGGVNSLSVEAMAAFNVAGKVDDFALLPEQNISHAMMTFISQNRGANNADRMKKGLIHGLRLEIGFSLITCAFLLIFRKDVINLFIKDNADAANMAYEYIAYMSVFYILPSITNGLQGYFRGMGRMGLTLVATLIQITVRVLSAFLMLHRAGITAIAYGSFAGWALMLVFQIPITIKLYKHTDVEVSDVSEKRI